MAVCEACGADNRDKARFCRGCARSLATGPETVLDEERPERPKRLQTCPACQASNPLAATVCKSCHASLIEEPPPAVAPTQTASAGVGGKGAVLAGVLLVALATGAWWWGAHGSPSARQVASLANASAPDSASAGGPDAVAGASSPDPTATVVLAQPAPKPESATQTRKRQQLEKRKERERLAALERERAVQAQEQRRADEARERAELAAKQAALARAADKAAKVPAQAPAPAQTVEQLCAGSSNVFTRDFCRIRECRKPTWASDPICISYRAMEKDRRNQLAN